MDENTTYRILTIDDDPGIRYSFCGCLSDFGYEVMEAEDGGIGLEMIAAEKPDLVLVDLRMPEVDGFKVLAGVRKAFPDMPVIVVSGTGDVSDVIEALRLGAWDYLLKPVEDMDLLLHAVKKGLDRACLIRKNRDYQDHLEEEVVKRTKDLSAAMVELRKLSMAVEQSPAMVMITNTQGVIEYVNPTFTEVMGYEAWEVIGHTPVMFSSGNTPKEIYEDMWRTIKSGKTWRGEFCNRKKSGEFIWEYAYISPILSENGSPNHFVGVKEDITVRKDYEKKLLHQAHYDRLTGLPNRLLILDRLAQAVKTKTENEHIAIILIGLDQFQQVNDTLGHVAGDKLLQMAVLRINCCIKGIDTVGRFGGDEFIVLLTGLSSPERWESGVEKILDAFSAPFQIQGHEFIITASIGITVCPKDGTDPRILLRNADAAMHSAKKSGRNRFHFFSKDINDSAIKRLQLEYHLRHALELDEISVHFQPIISTDKGRVVTVEALIRWTNHELGFISPLDFIPVAEESGLIVSIGEYVLRRAVTEAISWQAISQEPVRLAVNVSSIQFCEMIFFDTVKKILNELDMDPNLLELEMTESLLVVNVEQTVSMLEKLRKLGVSIVVDDFGTGYSSLSYLRRFPVQKLKIDKEFVNNLPHDREDSALARAIIAMGHSLNMTVVAEGVETVEQLDFLCSIRCDFIQGYYYSKPLPSDAFKEFLKKRNQP